jgi:hypothetical protein
MRKYLLKTADPEVTTIAPTSQINVKQLVRDSEGLIYRDNKMNQINQVLKYKLLSPKLNLFEHIKKVIFTMKEGEICLVRVPFEIHCLELREGQQKELYRRIEIVKEKKTKGGPGAMRDYVAELAKYEKVKSVGNEAFKKQDFENAIKQYQKAWRTLKCYPRKVVEKFKEEEMEKYQNLKMSLVNNLLAALYKNGQCKEAVNVIDDIKSQEALKPEFYTNLKFLGRVKDILLKLALDDRLNEELKSVQEEFGEDNDELVEGVAKLLKLADREMKKLRMQENKQMIKNYQRNLARAKEYEMEEKIRKRMME